MRTRLIVGVAIAILAGCSKVAPSGSEKQEVMDVREAPPTPSADHPVKIVVPQIAYSYSFTFRLPADAIDAAEDAHLALCDRMGALRCQVIQMDRAGGEGDYRQGTLKLAVASGEARRFGQALRASVGQAGGREIDSGISAGDLSKQIVDTDARLRAKQALADRLLEVARTRQGSVADLVAAERAAADAQEEIDAATSELAEARGRIAMSTIEIGYASGTPLGGGALEPARAAIGSIGAILGGLLALLIYVFIVGAPLAALAMLLLFVRRRLRAPLARLLRRDEID